MRTYTVKDSCARCTRVLEEREVTLEQVIEESDEVIDPEKYVTVTFPQTSGTTNLSFGKLCDTCQEFVQASLANLFTRIDSASSKRGKKSKDKDDADSNTTGSGDDGSTAHNDAPHSHEALRGKRA